MSFLRQPVSFGMLMGLALAARPVLAADPVAASQDSRAPGLIQNGDFEDAELEGWLLLSEGQAKGSIQRDAKPPREDAGTHSLRLTVVCAEDRCGVSYGTGEGLRVEEDTWYDLRFHARTEKRENNRGYGLTVSLERPDGGTVCARTTLPEVGGDWASYTVALHSYAAASDARLTITLSEPGTIWLDEIQCVPREKEPSHPK